MMHDGPQTLVAMMLSCDVAAARESFLHTSNHQQYSGLLIPHLWFARSGTAKKLKVLCSTDDVRILFNSLLVEY